MTSEAHLERAVSLLRALVQSPYSEFYRRKYAECEAAKKILEGEVSEAVWRDIPFLTRDELQSAPYHDRLFIPDSQVGIVRLTSGTSGRGLLLMPRMNDEGEKHAVLFDSFFRTYAFKRYATFSGAQFQHGDMFKKVYGLDSIHLDAGNIPGAAAFVHVYKPDIIAGFAYAVNALYPHLEKAAIETVRCIYLFGERCTRAQWRLLHEQFPQAVVVEDYASVDAQTTVGFPCAEIIKDQQQHVHPIPEYVYVEIIDPETGNTVEEEGKSGEIVITVLRPVAAPLVRYRTGDSARIVAHACACGTKTPVLEIEGRIGMDKLRFSGGELNLAEIERVFRVVKSHLRSDSFEVHFKEVRKGNRALPHVAIHLEWDTSAISASKLAGMIAKELRVLEDKTYDLGVRNGEFDPLSIVPLQKTGVIQKRRAIVRDDA